MSLWEMVAEDFRLQWAILGRIWWVGAIVITASATCIYCKKRTEK